MSAILGFLHFWYDFIVGDAWEVAAGVVVALVLAWLLMRAGLDVAAWLIVPVLIAAVLAASLVRRVRQP